MKREIEILVYYPLYPHREMPRIYWVTRAIKERLGKMPVTSHLSANWSSALYRVSVYDDQLIIWWEHGVAKASYQALFDRVWATLGDQRPTAHRDANDMDDDEVIPF